MLVLEDVLQVDDLVGLVAHGEHGDLVEDLHGAVHAAADAGRKLGRVLYPGFAMRAFLDGGEEAAENGNSLSETTNFQFSKATQRDCMHSWSEIILLGKSIQLRYEFW